MKTRLLAGGLLAALVLTGCGDDGPARGDTAARVGDTRITTERVADLVQQVRDEPAAADAQSDLPSFQRDILGLLVTSATVDTVCRREGVQVTQAQVDASYAELVESQGGEPALLEKAAQQGLSRELLFVAQRTRVQQQALGDKLTEGTFIDPAQLAQAYQQFKDSFDEASISQIVLATRAEADALLPQAKALDDEGFKKLASERTTQEEARATGGVLNGLLLSAFTEAGQQAYGEAVFKAKAGDTFVVPNQGGAYVVRVLERKTTSLEEATPRLRQELLGDQIQTALTAKLASVPVQLNARFGTWDPETMSVTAPGARSSRPLSVPGPTPTPLSLGAGAAPAGSP